MRDEGRRGAALVLAQIDKIDEYLSACQLGITMASLGIGFLGEPAIAKLIESGLGESVSHGFSLAISISIAYLITTALHITVGEQVPKIYAIVHAERTALRVARPLQWFRVASSPLIWLLNTASNAILRLVGVDAKAEFEEISSSEDLKLLIARSATGGKLDPGEAGHALRCLSPARAAGAPGDDADPGSRHRGCLRDGGDGAAAGDRLRPHSAGGHREREHRPHQGHGPRELAGPSPDDRGARRPDRRQRQGRADRARDQAARRSAGRSPARACLDGRGGGRVRPHRWDRLGRGHHRGGRGRDRRRDRPGRGRNTAPGQRGLVGSRPRAHHRPRRLRPRPPGGLRGLQLRRRLRVRRARPAAQARGHGSGQRLLPARRSRAPEPRGGRAHPRPPRHATRVSPATAPTGPSSRPRQPRAGRASGRRPEPVCPPGGLPSHRASGAGAGGALGRVVREVQ